MVKKRKVILWIVSLLAAGGIFFSGLALGFRAGELHPQTITIEGVSGINNKSVNADFSVFWEAWDLISKNYLNDGDIDAEQKVQGAVAGLVQSLGDPHSQFFSPVDTERFQEDVQGNFGGIGAEIGTKANQIVVVAPLKGSPAERAGLRAEDIILAINTTSTEGMSVEDAVRIIRGPKGTEVKLTIFRVGLDKPKEIKIIRDTIITPTVDFSMKGGNIAYIELHRFNANAERLFYEAMVQALGQGAQGMILDLRNDPGGYLDVAVDLAGWFVPRGKLIVSEASREATTQEFRASGNAALTDFPVVILINGGSASASEILAGTLRDNRGTKLIGEKTFGKGTVQQIMDLKDGSTLKLTIAHWVLPSGRILDHDGLEPDIEVKPSEKDIESKNDVQLSKALEVMRGMIK